MVEQDEQVEKGITLRPGWFRKPSVRGGAMEMR